MYNKNARPRDIRRDNRTLTHTTRGGKLMPVMAVPFKPNEGGSVSANIYIKLDQIAGELVTDIRAQLTAVFVPAPAIDAHINPNDDYPGNEGIFREKLLGDVPIFGLEEEGEISKACGITPKSVDGIKYVCGSIRPGHNAAVNHLRLRKYVKANQLLASNTAITPALVSQTILEKMGGVLDPEDRVNGSVHFVTPASSLPVAGLGAAGGAFDMSINESVKNVFGDTATWPTSYDGDHIRLKVTAEGVPEVFAVQPEANHQLSLTDFYRAERMDQLTREMRQLVDKFPQYGEEIVTRFAHGLSLDVGSQPIVVYDRIGPLSNFARSAMDGPSIDMVRTLTQGQASFDTFIPTTEFGGNLYVFVSVLPDEVIADQPHPIASELYGVDNFVADEMVIDPVPVTIRELNSECDPADEATVAMYVGNHGLRKTYLQHGFSRNVDPTTVANKSAVWQLELPMSVTPASVIYPEDLTHYPFADQQAEVCRILADVRASISTPTIYGPSPIEELAQIETDDIFEEEAD